MTNIKFFIRIFAAVGIVFALASCNQKAEFHTTSYVAMSASSIDVREDAGSVEIPVYAYTQQGDLSFPRAESANTMVTFEVIPGTALDGENYSVEPANGVLNFSNSSEATITVTVVDHDDPVNIDPTRDFTIRLTSTTNGYDIGGMDQTVVNITDADNPLLEIAGTYVAEDVRNTMSGALTDFTLNIQPVSGSTIAVTVTGLLPVVDAEASVVGVVSGNIITLMSQQTVAQSGGENVDFYAIVSLDLSAGMIQTGRELTMTIDKENGTLTADYGWGSMSVADDGVGVYEAYVEHGVVFTRLEE